MNYEWAGDSVEETARKSAKVGSDALVAPVYMQRMAGWERQSPKKFKAYGSQQYWRKEWEEL